MFRTHGYASGDDIQFTGHGELGFCFDERAAHASVQALAHHIAPLVHAQEQDITFGELFASTCNTSPTDSARYRQAIEVLIEHKELVVIGEKGQRRQRASIISGHDRLKMPSQRHFWTMI
jgi:hypothetical protein